MKFKSYILRLACLACLLLSQTALAQFTPTMPKRNVDDLTDAEITLFMEKAQASGMSESEIEKAAMTQGYTAADIAKMRERMISIQASPSTSSPVIDPFTRNNALDLNYPTESRTNKTYLLNNPNNRFPRPVLQENPLNLDERKLLAKPLDIYNDSIVNQYNTLQKRLANSLDKKILGQVYFKMIS